MLRARTAKDKREELYNQLCGSEALGRRSGCGRSGQSGGRGGAGEVRVEGEGPEIGGDGGVGGEGEVNVAEAEGISDI